MNSNNDIKQHVSIKERDAWNKCIEDFANHLGAGGVPNHRLANGTVAGFSDNNFTNDEKIKLADIEAGALNNPHPATHPASMITGLAQVATTGNYWHLTDIPDGFTADGGNADTVGGIRVVIGELAPTEPINDKEIWISTADFIIRIYHDAWVPLKTVYA